MNEKGAKKAKETAKKCRAAQWVMGGHHCPQSGNETSGAMEAVLTLVG